MSDDPRPHAPSTMPPGHSQQTPGLVIILLDQSGSMADPWSAQAGISKAARAAELVNQCLAELLMVSRAGRRRRPGEKDQLLNRTFVAVFGYRTRGSAGSDSVLLELAKGWPQQLAEQGGPEKVWIRPTGLGGRTPMGIAFAELAAILNDLFQGDSDFTRAFAHSMPPLVIHLSDGQENRGISLAEGVAQLKAVRTPNALVPCVFNVHISSEFADSEILFPTSDAALDQWGRVLYHSSDPIPESLRPEARRAFRMLDWSQRRIGLVVNAGPEAFVRLLRMGFDTVAEAAYETSVDD